MHKRKKGKYGIFHSPKEKPVKIFKALSILIFFLIFSAVLHGKAYSIAARNNRLKTASVFNVSAGFIHYYNGDYPDAVRYFKKESPDLLKNSYFNYVLAVLYFKNGEYRKSLKHINIALNLAPQNIKSRLAKNEIKYLILKAKIKANQGKLKQSAAILKHILQKNPYNLKTLLFLSNLYIYEKDFNTAVFYLNIIKLNIPDNINAYYLLSKIYAVQNKNKKAERELISLINIDPYFKKAYFRLAALYILTGK